MACILLIFNLCNERLFSISSSYFKSGNLKLSRTRALSFQSLKSLEGGQDHGSGILAHQNKISRLAPQHHTCVNHFLVTLRGKIFRTSSPRIPHILEYLDRERQQRLQYPHNGRRPASCLQPYYNPATRRASLSRSNISDSPDSDSISGSTTACSLRRYETRPGFFHTRNRKYYVPEGQILVAPITMGPSITYLQLIEQLTNRLGKLVMIRARILHKVGK